MSDKTEIEKWTEAEGVLFGLYDQLVAEWEDATDDQLRARRQQLDRCSCCVVGIEMVSDEWAVVEDCEAHYHYIEQLQKIISTRLEGTIATFDE